MVERSIPGSASKGSARFQNSSSLSMFRPPTLVVAILLVIAAACSNAAEPSTTTSAADVVTTTTTSPPPLSTTTSEPSGFTMADHIEWVVAALNGAPINEDDDEISWDISANYALNDNSSLWTRYASGFRAQTIQGRDVAFGQSPSVADSETIDSIEAGYKADLPPFYYLIAGTAGKVVDLESPPYVKINRNNPRLQLVTGIKNTKAWRLIETDDPFLFGRFNPVAQVNLILGNRGAGVTGADFGGPALLDPRFQVLRGNFRFPGAIAVFPPPLRPVAGLAGEQEKK